MQYTELQVTSNFSFLQGASHPEELMGQAAALGYTAMAITDANTMAGIVRAHVAAKKSGIRLIVGCRLLLQDGSSLLAYPKNKIGYASLCELLSTGNARAEKGDCLLYKKDVVALIKDTILVIVPPAKLNEAWQFDERFLQELSYWKFHFGNDFYAAVQRRYNGHDAKWLYQLNQALASVAIKMVATNDVYYHVAERRQLQDVLTCIREKCTIYNAGFLLYPNAERYLKDEKEMKRLFMPYPEAILHTQEIAAACTFSLDELQYEYPEEITTDGRTPQEELRYRSFEGAMAFYGNPLPATIVERIEYELRFIAEMNYAAYFLTVYDIVRFARSRGILCQGRGSAANSAVCFCLGITAVNPAKFDLLFERFISAARNEPPDIDVDFEHERREEVIQYIYSKYGRDRAGIVATVTQQHQRGAIRDVARAMGLSADTISKISGTIHRMSQDFFSNDSMQQIGLDTSDRHLQKTLLLTHQYIGFPRQLGQHTGGFVITRQKLWHLCPVLNARMPGRTCIEWNKDDIEAMGFLKIDVLALGMLTCIRKAFDFVKLHYNRLLTLANIPQDDPNVYEMICQADTIGVFQIESRAQQSMLPRLKPRSFYDLVIEVAIVRPGPIQGDMVHPYLRRRNGEEAVTYPSPELKAILERTLGVPLFQEQAMKIAIVGAGFTPAEADELRRSMATFKAKGEVGKLQKKLIDGMIANGYTPDYAQRVFKQLEGFGSYGFPESHAASFALLVYVSSWLKYYYPDAFACALLNSMPMGFYAPAQIVADAQRHGVVVRPVDINHSFWDNTLEEKDGAYCALRLGFRQVKGMRQSDVALLLNKRQQQFSSIDDVLRICLPDSMLEKLADADAFVSIGLNRREALWHLSVKDKSKALFAELPTDTKGEEHVQLPVLTNGEQVLLDYASTSLSLKAHPVSFVRHQLTMLQVVSTKDLPHLKNGDRIKISGLVLVRQRPQTAKGVWFVTLEDEWGTANLVVFPQVALAFKKELLQAKLLMAEGELQVVSNVIHLAVKKCADLSRLLGALQPSVPSATIHAKLSRADEVKNMNSEDKRVKQVLKEMPDSRNFR